MEQVGLGCCLTKDLAVIPCRWNCLASTMLWLWWWYCNAWLSDHDHVPPLHLDQMMVWPLATGHCAGFLIGIIPWWPLFLSISNAPLQLINEAHHLHIHAIKLHPCCKGRPVLLCWMMYEMCTLTMPNQETSVEWLVQNFEVNEDWNN